MVTAGLLKVWQRVYPFLQLHCSHRASINYFTYLENKLFSLVKFLSVREESAFCIVICWHLLVQPPKYQINALQKPQLQQSNRSVGVGSFFWIRGLYYNSFCQGRKRFWIMICWHWLVHQNIRLMRLAKAADLNQSNRSVGVKSFFLSGVFIKVEHNDILINNCIWFQCNQIFELKRWIHDVLLRIQCHLEHLFYDHADDLISCHPWINF